MNNRRMLPLIILGVIALFVLMGLSSSIFYTVNATQRAITREEELEDLLSVVGGDWSFTGLPGADLSRATLTGVKLREADLLKPPGVAESLDWARALQVIGADHLDGFGCGGDGPSDEAGRGLSFDRRLYGDFPARGVLQLERDRRAGLQRARADRHAAALPPGPGPGRARRRPPCRRTPSAARR